MAYPTTEILILKSVFSNLLNRVLKPGEILDVPDVECGVWLRSGIASPPPPPEIDTEFCAYLVDDENNQCQRKPGNGPDSLYCKQHAKKVMADAGG